MGDWIDGERSVHLPGEGEMGNCLLLLSKETVLSKSKWHDLRGKLDA